jgi:hypothetical protein
MTEATTTTTETKEASSKRSAESLVDTLFDIGLGWAAHGLTIGKLALEQSAKTLEKTASTLAAIATELEKKDEKAA